MAKILNVFVDGKVIEPYLYIEVDGKVQFLKPLIEINPSPIKFDEKGKPEFWVIFEYEYQSEDT